MATYHTLLVSMLDFWGLPISVLDEMFKQFPPWPPKGSLGEKLMVDRPGHNVDDRSPRVTKWLKTQGRCRITGDRISGLFHPNQY